MTLQGKIHNGRVVFDNPVNLPEGTPVTVSVEPETIAISDRLTTEQIRQRKAMFDEITALPMEGPGGFSGADHDKVLYGKPQ